ncbi:1-phosphofructokinase family hexose kinase [Flavihumibacter rivuli]|uniref:1-phosphofructokinase family hexose kinase n=1 Tax=Flavihumibacter rivuli TaxID=2838156 RepID=UPI001BDDD789|nr:1-phosphofructokinase family hexose kinase [Flavihumibacter rivuli]ULQ55592.1 1-phosphofructokinase family hexose kinase [Flavihumibacter rivuli]
MILTITPNPAVDKSTSTEQLIPEKKLRCTEMVVEAGGGGINVSKALQELGAPTLALFTSGGLNGQQLEKAVARESVEYLTIPIAGETRENLVVLERNSNNQFRFVLPGPTMPAGLVQDFIDRIESLPTPPAVIVGSGSLPPGCDEGFYAALAEYAASRDIPCIIDCSGVPLLKAAQKGVFLLKPNLNELAQLAGKEKLETIEVAEAARKLLAGNKCKMVVVSMGAQGAMVITKEGHLQIPAPTVKKQSTVGAGDSMVAGMAYQLWKGADPFTMARFGIACGTAATMNPGTQLFNKYDVERLYQWMLSHK